MKLAKAKNEGFLDKFLRSRSPLILDLTLALRPHTSILNLRSEISNLRSEILSFKLLLLTNRPIILEPCPRAFLVAPFQKAQEAVDRKQYPQAVTLLRRAPHDTPISS